MNRNSYVTAALFVVFVLLTVVYFNLDNTPEQGPVIGLNGIETPLPVGDLVNQPAEDDEEDNDTGTDTHQGELNQGNNQGETGQGTEGGNASEGGQGETGSELGAGSDVSETETQTTSAIAALRNELAAHHSARVSRLTEVIASVDYSAQEKSDARDQMTSIDRLQQNSSILETTIRSMGLFNDVLVQADEAAESVILHVEIDSLDNKPGRETVAELTLLAGQQFGSRNRISVNFTAVD